jgi:Protein of unknown function (DUF3293)
MDNSYPPIDERLILAYEQTLYVAVFSANERHVVRIGERHALLDERLAEQKLNTWAFITAYNPGSALLSGEENVFLQNLLEATLKDRRLPYWPAYHESKDGAWPTEKSCFVAGLDENTALEIARMFAQKAVVFGKNGEKARLMWRL